MPEHASAGWILLAALLTATAGMGWLALAMTVHAEQAWGRVPAMATLRMLRGIGCLAIGASLALCLIADHPSMATLVWLMALSGASLLVALVLSTRPRWLAVLAPWVRPMTPPVRDGHTGPAATRTRIQAP